MSEKFHLPPLGDGQWTEEAAIELAGKEILLGGQVIVVLDCHLEGDGSLRGTFEVSNV
jgi:hypothetical protein